MRTPLRSLTCAVAAAVLLGACAPAETGDPGAAAPASPASTTTSPASTPDAPTPDTPTESSGSEDPTEATTTPSPSATGSAREPVEFRAGRTDFSERPAPQGVHPVRVRIPAIGVDANVEDMGLNADGSIEVPEVFADAGWWDRSPEPGRVGASTILGHIDSTSGPAVFYRLRELRPGDEIHVDGEDGDAVTFVVQRTEQYAKAEFPSQEVLGATPTPTLRLITCGGAFNSNTGHYVDNVVVYADVATA